MVRAQNQVGDDLRIHDPEEVADAIGRDCLGKSVGLRLDEERERSPEELAVRLLQTSPDADPAVQVFPELDEQSRQGFEVGTREFQRPVGQALLDLGKRLLERDLDTGQVGIHIALKTFRAEWLGRHRALPSGM